MCFQVEDDESLQKVPGSTMQTARRDEQTARQ
jgi:hypothetical protein